MWNLLGTALRLIPPVTVQYQKYIGETVNELGICVPQYADPDHYDPGWFSAGTVWRSHDHRDAVSDSGNRIYFLSVSDPG